MRIRKFLCALILALFSLQTLNFTARADEGMWTFNNVPRAEIKKRYGFDVTDEWLKKVQLASVRFNNGGSGSFVSPNGLVLTNYHIVEDIVGQLSTAEKDYAKDGFVAHSLMPCKSACHGPNRLRRVIDRQPKSQCRQGLQTRPCSGGRNGL